MRVAMGYQVLRLIEILLPICLVVCAPIRGERVRAEQDATVDQVLQLAGAYVQQYEQVITAVVAQENYRQVLLPSGESRAGTETRRTRAYLLVLDVGRPGWVAFRDVFEVDGRPVRERDERLSRLLTQITPDALGQARLIAAESARFNLNPRGVKLDRTINTPMTALLFLRTASQSRSTFRLGRTERIGGLTCVALNFQEVAAPRLIRLSDGGAARGTFWIDVATGRVLRSDLRLDASGGRRGPEVHSQITVKYAHVAKLDLWLPESMDESYDLLPSRQFVSGHAEYSDFRQFNVTTAEGVK
jgi:hypothetical protein